MQTNFDEDMVTKVLVEMTIFLKAYDTKRSIIRSYSIKIKLAFVKWLWLHILIIMKYLI